MSRRTPIRPAERSRRPFRRAAPILILVVAVLGGAIAALIVRRAPPVASTDSDARRQLTFHRDIAPIIYRHCASCHHPGEAAPFSLLTYEDVHKRARQIVDVTTRRLMPPWMPEAGPFPLEGDRSLPGPEIGLIQKWVEQGGVEGSPRQAPAPPAFNDRWQLGTPDAIVTMSEAYVLPADGPDRYRNFVVPVANPERRFVRAVEFHPGNSRIVHHAFLLLDPTRDSRRADDAEPGPGFDGLHTPRSAQAPEGHFLSWQPGKRPMAEAGGYAWRLERDSDLVLQMHLRPSGRPESLQASVGFYFTNRPPARIPFKVGMKSFTLDIPAGAEAHWVQDELTLPVDVEVLAILPHAHSLAAELHITATPPGQPPSPLLTIPRWDFNWQGDYTYRQPVFLPQGTTVQMRYRYDNSTNNPANPNSPPQPVKYGLNTSNEMAELWMLVLPRKPDDLPALAQSYQPRVLEEALLYNRYLLGINPTNARALTEIGKVHFARKQLADAGAFFQQATKAAPDLDEPHYFLGLLRRTEGQPDVARLEFQTAVSLNPFNARAHGNLGLIALELGATNEAAAAFREALKLNPEDELARRNLERLTGSEAPNR